MTKRGTSKGDNRMHLFQSQPEFKYLLVLDKKDVAIKLWV